LLLVNGAQAAVFTGVEEPGQAIQALNAWYAEVVVKLGPDGALYANGQDPVRVPAQPPKDFVDGTGVGGAFCAGFLHSWLDKKPPAEALSSGYRLAARAVARVGARPEPGVPRRGRNSWRWTPTRP